jgi:hypothetical protein
MYKALIQFREKFAVAWTACMLCMVQGDLTVVSLSHAITASKTGALSGVAYALVSLTGKDPKTTILAAALTGALTMVADLIAHPTHFGPEWMEAFCTGIGAAVLLYIWERKSSYGKP